MAIRAPGSWETLGEGHDGSIWPTTIRGTIILAMLAGIILGVSTQTVIPSTEQSMRCVGRQYSRQEIRPTPRKTGRTGIKRPRNNGEDKGVVYPRRQICKALLGYRGNNRRHTREVLDWRAPHRSRTSSSLRQRCRRRGSSRPRSILGCRGGRLTPPPI